MLATSIPSATLSPPGSLELSPPPARLREPTTRGRPHPHPPPAPPPRPPARQGTIRPPLFTSTRPSVSRAPMRSSSASPLSSTTGAPRRSASHLRPSRPLTRPLPPFAAQHRGGRVLSLLRPIPRRDSARALRGSRQQAAARTARPERRRAFGGHHIPVDQVDILDRRWARCHGARLHGPCHPLTRC